ncbi:MAG: hypothetical protein A3D31_10610 [Candidatus Fluviicola riflensis]|nr:MAG: hypothetical protein CHH17_15030 [Candidatus Fluviicola riflensis]OGS77450.1 MAG: hypothetical protein A3D31_10610 [Candidatus Fluviicola riflensis]OGS84030.1 MAG: hypothetical protein A3E30_12010 [Fluviicola sp. RIFCSPHIGHO2_12_FULL_43_24]OGS84517.1 MAG: hypothetical protein A2724_07550 [Fluviicola sp. RIFCSPHIGHO2_01_FULL_43_53]
MIQQQNNWTSWRKGFTLSATFLLALLVATSCKKETNTIGLGALDPDALLSSGGVDTFQLTTFSVAEDTIPTDNQTFGILGAYHDPKMGTFNASIYSQFHLSNTISFDAGDQAIVDSVVLSLRYRGYYGELDPQTFEVYELDDTMDVDRDYYKNDVEALKPSNLVLASSETQTPNPSDSVWVGSTKKPAQLRLTLNNAWAQTIMDDATGGNAAFTDDALFENYMKGLHVKVANANPAVGKGGVFYFDMEDNNTKVTIYYHLQADPGSTPYELVLEVEDDCADFNHVEIDNSGYPVANVLSNPINGQNQYYAQAFQSRGKVEFPTLNNVPKTAVIHDALLVIPISHQTLSSFYPSNQLTVGYKTDEGEIIGFNVILYDDSKKSYIIDVRNYVQDIVSGDAENRGVFLYPTFFSSTAERIIFNGPNTSNKEKPKLIVKYTEY